MRRALLAVSLTLFHTALCWADGCWDQTVEFLGRAFDYRQGGEVHLFVPFSQSGRSLIFTDARALYMKHQWGGGLGLGFRHATGCGAGGEPSLGLGLALFADFAHSDGGVDHFQGTVSAEIFGEHWEVHANGYFPDTSRAKVDERRVFELFTRPNTAPDLGEAIVSEEFDEFDIEQAYRGFDIEAGVYGCYGPGRVRAYAGYFRYTGHKRPVIEGPRFRAEYIFDSYWLLGEAQVRIGFEIQHDHVRGIETNFFAGITIPFWGCRSQSPRCRMSLLCTRMGEKVQRETGLIIESKAEREFLRQRIIANIFFVEQNGTGSGTQGSPTNLAAAVGASSPSDVIFLLNNNGPITNLNPTTLQDRQQLVSFDAMSMVTLNFPEDQSLTITDATGTGRGVLDGSGNTVVVEIANDNTIQGIGIDGAGVNAMEAVGIRNTAAIDGFTLTDTLIANLGAGVSATSVTGVELTDISGTVTITGNTLSTFTGDAAVNGVEIDNTAVDTSITMSMNTVEALTSVSSTADGLTILGSGAGTLSVTLNQNSITGLTADAGVLGSASGIELLQADAGGSVTLTATENSIRTLQGGGILSGIAIATDGTASNTTVDMTLTSNTVDSLTGGTFADGIRVEGESDGTAAVTITGTLSMNSVSNVKRGIVGQTDFNLGTDMLILGIEQSTTNMCADQAINVVNRAGGTGNTELMLSDNSDSESGIAAYAVTHEAGFAGTSCLQMTGNNTDNSNGIVLTNNGGVFRVVNFNDLSADNNNIPVVTQGTGGFTNTTTPCTAP